MAQPYSELLRRGLPNCRPFSKLLAQSVYLVHLYQSCSLLLPNQPTSPNDFSLVRALNLNLTLKHVRPHLEERPSLGNGNSSVTNSISARHFRRCPPNHLLPSLQPSTNRASSIQTQAEGQAFALAPSPDLPQNPRRSSSIPLLSHCPDLHPAVQPSSETASDPNSLSVRCEINVPDRVLPIMLT